MKILTKYFGKVNKLNPAPELSHVTLKNIENGTTVETNIETKKLLEEGIDHNDCEFEVVIQETLDGKVEGILTKIKKIL
jgi:hypothetical protein